MTLLLFIGYSLEDIILKSFNLLDNKGKSNSITSAEF